MSPSRRRKSFNLRLQPYEGTLLAEVVVYLNSLERDEANRKIAALLIMCLLPLARQKQGEVFSEQEKRMCCLEACDALSKHSSFLRQALRVSQPQFEMPYLMAPMMGSFPSVEEQRGLIEKESSSSAPQTKLSPSIEGKGSAADVDSIFGDDD